MPSPVLETAQQRASEEMTGMSFLEHLEELRAASSTARSTWSAASRSAGGFTSSFRLHAEAHHYGAGQSPSRTEAGVPHPTDPFNMYLKISFLAGSSWPRRSFSIRSGPSSRRRLHAMSAVTFCPSCSRRLGFFSPAAGSATGWSIRRRWIINVSALFI